MSKRGGALLLALVGALAPLAPALAGPGAEKFAATCAACHGQGGTGVEGLAPPLLDPELWSRLGPQAPRYLAGVMASGMGGKLTVKGVDYVGLIMPSQADLPTADLVLIGNYILGEVNKQPVTLDAATIDQAKQKPPSHKDLRAWRGN